MRDEMLPGRDVATYWIEHVLRHGGTRHLQLSAKNLGFIQKHLIDVWLFLGGVVFLLVILFVSILRCACNCLRKPSKQKIQ